MTAQGMLQLGVYLAVLLLLAKPLGAYMAAVFEGRRTFVSVILAPAERLIYRAAGIDAANETGWKRYAFQVLLANAIGLLVVYVLQRLQAVLRLNPQGFGAVSPDSSFNTAVSFAGVGLGLSICRAILRAHGMDITAGTSPAGGARFEFTLPMKSLDA